MTFWYTFYFLFYTVILFAATATVEAKFKNLGLTSIVAVIFGFIGFLINVPYFNAGFMVFVIMMLSAFVTYELILKDKNGGMKTDIQSLILGFIAWTLMSEFFSSFITYTTYIQSNTFPIFTNYISYSNAVAQAQALMGGPYNYYIVGGLINWFIRWVAYFPIGLGEWVYNMLVFGYLAFVWALGLVNFMFTYFPSVFRIIFETIFYSFVGFSLLFAISGPLGISLGKGSKS